MSMSSFKGKIKEKKRVTRQKSYIHEQNLNGGNKKISTAGGIVHAILCVATINIRTHVHMYVQHQFHLVALFFCLSFQIDIRKGKK